MKKSHYIAVAAALLISSTAWAGALTIPNTFTAGSPAVAADVNANFTAAKTAVDDNNTRITANTASAATNASNITANASAITTLQNAVLVRTINVSPVIGGGGVIDAVASGNALIAAVGAITGSSASNQFTVKLEPGTYDLVAQTLTLPDGVNLEGSGQSVTTISNTLSIPTAFPMSGTVVVLGSSNIRNIRLENLTTSTDITVAMSMLLDLRAGSVLIENSTLFAYLPILAQVGSSVVKAVVLNSRLEQPTLPINQGIAPIQAVNANASIDVVSSQLGTAFNLGKIRGNVRCFSSYFDNFTASNATCK